MFGLLRLVLALAFIPLRAFLRIAITNVKTTVAPAAVETEGAQVHRGGVVNLINDLKANAAPAFGNAGIATKSGTTNTWSAADMLGGVIKRYGIQSSADLTDTAANIVGAIPGAQVGQTFPLMVANLTSGTITPAGGTGVTLLGTSTILRFSTKLFVGKVLGSAAVTLEAGFTFPNSGQE